MHVYNEHYLPFRATIRLAMASGTLVPKARNVSPMTVSGIPNVSPVEKQEHPREA